MGYSKKVNEKCKVFVIICNIITYLHTRDLHSLNQKVNARYSMRGVLNCAPFQLEFVGSFEQMDAPSPLELSTVETAMLIE